MCAETKIKVLHYNAFKKTNLHCNVYQNINKIIKPLKFSSELPDNSSHYLESSPECISSSPVYMSYTHKKTYRGALNSHSENVCIFKII